MLYEIKTKDISIIETTTIENYYFTWDISDLINNRTTNTKLVVNTLNCFERYPAGIKGIDIKDLKFKSENSRFILDTWVEEIILKYVI
jgi:hypothetical protein